MLNTLSNYIPAASERVLMTIGGAIGAAFSFAFGNVGPLIVWLSIFVSVDMCLGVLAAVHKGRWQARVMFWGVIRKVTMFCIVALAHGLDITLHDLIHIDFVQSIVIVAYTAAEFGSIIKNLEKAGLGGVVPPILRYILYAINDYLEDRAKKTVPVTLRKDKKDGE